MLRAVPRQLVSAPSLLCIERGNRRGSAEAPDRPRLLKVRDQAENLNPATIELLGK